MFSPDDWDDVFSENWDSDFFSKRIEIKGVDQKQYSNWKSVAKKHQEQKQLLEKIKSEEKIITSALIKVLGNEFSGTNLSFKFYSIPFRIHPVNGSGLKPYVLFTYGPCNERGIKIGPNPNKREFTRFFDLAGVEDAIKEFYLYCIKNDKNVRDLALDNETAALSLIAPDRRRSLLTDVLVILDMEIPNN